MCGRFHRDIPWSELRGAFEPLGDMAAPNMEPELDIRPTTQQWVVRPADGGRELLRMRWGLVPFWHAGKSLKDFRLTTFNAKAETVATAATFKGAFARRRCLVPASGWYEWTGPKGGKTKWRFTPRDGGWLTFAGIWDRCTTSDAGVVESFTVVTQPAGDTMNAYHDRTPVVISAEERGRWLNAEADVADLLGPESIDAYRIELAA